MIVKKTAEEKPDFRKIALFYREQLLIYIAMQDEIIFKEVITDDDRAQLLAMREFAQENPYPIVQWPRGPHIAWKEQASAFIMSKVPDNKVGEERIRRLIFLDEMTGSHLKLLTDDERIVDRLTEWSRKLDMRMFSERQAKQQEKREAAAAKRKAVREYLAAENAKEAERLAEGAKFRKEQAQRLKITKAASRGRKK